MSRASANHNAYGASLIPTVTFRSQMSPEVVYDPDAPKKTPNPLVKAILRLVKPAIYVKTPINTIVHEPFGKPTTNYLAPVVLGALGIAAFIGFAAGVTAGSKR